MRSESDKKNKKTSITMTHNDYEIIEQRAKEKHMGVSSYMVLKTIHADDTLSPEKRARIQNIINDACMAVESYAPEIAIELQKEAEEIWSL